MKFLKKKNLLEIVKEIFYLKIGKKPTTMKLRDRRYYKLRWKDKIESEIKS